MRWIAMPVIAAVVSCALWAAPVSARVEKSSKPVATAKAASAGKAGSKAAKPVKAGQKTAAAKPIAKSSKAKAAGKPAKAGKTLKASKSRPALTRGGKKGRPVVKTASVPDVEPQPVAAIDPNDAASERVYDGLLPTAEEKIVMPVVKDENGRAECVQLIKSLMDAPRTMFWKEGRKLKASWDKIQPGTAIATFIKGRYPQQGRGRGTKHAAIFLRATAGGIYVFDQFAGQADAEERFIPWHHPRDKRPSNNATAFSTVRW